MKNMTFDLIIFDCDGTLVDSLDGIARAAQRALDELGYHRNLSHDDIAQVVGLSLDEAMAVLMPDADPEFRTRAVQGYKRHYQTMADGRELLAPLFPGVRDTLETLEAAGIVMGVATGKSLRGLQRTFQEHDLARFFSAVMTADQAPSKPHPAMVENILRATGFSASQTLMVGDTLYDIEMGRNAGTYTAAVTYGCHSRARLAEARPDHWLETMPELLAIAGARAP
ncbi:MAG: HAD-IA family hydrolase [Magnetococcales bacterium]|nr:HAD-IA family hydrolase [Magnetococcales bacterium]